MNNLMVWVDMETTGLSAQADYPLELGLVITDRELNVMAEFAELLLPLTSVADVRAVCSEIVVQMHTENGLFEDLRHAGKCFVAPKTLERAALDFLDDHDVPFGSSPMYGSSIGSLDRPFMLQWFPELNKHFHYRNVDVSTVKELCKMYNPELYAKIDAEHKEYVGADKGHRVLSDCKASINELGLYLREFLFVEYSE